MESVSSDFILFVIFHGQRVEIMFRRHALIECRIKDSHLWNFGKQFLARKDGLQICRIMQWSQIRTFRDFSDNIICDDDGVLEIFPSMDDSMSYRIDSSMRR